MIITAGKWWKRVADDLRETFPDADLEIVNKAIGMFPDRYEPPINTDTIHELATTVAQGFPNGKHTLALRPEGDRVAAIRAIRIYPPPLRDDD